MPHVRLEELPRLRVVSALGFGPSPEPEAWRLIREFAAAHDLEVGQQRFFGFDNPSPSPGSPNYGYELWMTVPEHVTAQPPYEITHTRPGRYAVVRFTGLEHIGEMWQELAAWFDREGHAIPPGCGQCLEEQLLDRSGSTPESWTFDLHLALQD